MSKMSKPSGRAVHLTCTLLTPPCRRLRAMLAMLELRSTMAYLLRAGEVVRSLGKTPRHSHFNSTTPRNQLWG